MQTFLMHSYDPVKRRVSVHRMNRWIRVRFFLLVGLVAPVRNQKALGSCWAVSTAEAVEGLPHMFFECVVCSLMELHESVCCLLAWGFLMTCHVRAGGEDNRKIGSDVS